MFIPLRDENPSGKVGYVNIGLLLTNVAVFLYQLQLMVTSPRAIKAMELTYSTVPARISGWVGGQGSFECGCEGAGHQRRTGNRARVWRGQTDSKFDECRHK